MNICPSHTHKVPIPGKLCPKRKVNPLRVKPLAHWLIQRVKPCISQRLIGSYRLVGKSMDMHEVRGRGPCNGLIPKANALFPSLSFDKKSSASHSPSIKA
ncbi:tetrahydrocannabinolic acid synthase-like [Dorcoceras hygrometricum]|uniref:Tetrahydrocannabinolic acid synthase-like n=1 Tax=Dorcoceras hygrometricum TaxID=472368 RepID=A0A2Z7CE38_9LAMI|nr:tetrahydrocannabinolic acid synthase-like [Dorcoceras hygrometricum]